MITGIPLLLAAFLFVGSKDLSPSHTALEPTTPAAGLLRTMDSSKTPSTDQKYRMVALDLDGTLLRSDHKISEATRDYLQHLDAKGFTVIIATGRAAATVFEHVQRLDFPHPIPVVCSNGARGLMCSIQDDDGSVTYEELFTTPVPEKVARKTIALSKELGYVSQYYVGEEIYADPREPHHLELTERYKSLTGCETIYVKDDFEEAIAKGEPSKQLVLCPAVQQDDMIESFEKELSKNEFLINGKSPTIVRGSMGWFLEVLHPNVCKGNGLKNMCDHLKIPIEQCCAFGDGDNDLEFINMAGKGIVMKNGRQCVKDVGDLVLDLTNNQDGVMKTLQQMEGQGDLIFSKDEA